MDKLLPNDKKMYAEQPRRVCPKVRWFKSAGHGKVTHAVNAVFVRVFRVDEFARFKAELESANLHALSPAADQMHFDACEAGIINRAMLKLPEIEIGSKFSINLREMLRLNAAVTPRLSLYANSNRRASFSKVRTKHKALPPPNCRAVCRSSATASARKNSRSLNLENKQRDGRLMHAVLVNGERVKSAHSGSTSIAG